MWSSRICVVVFLFLMLISCKSSHITNFGTVSNITDMKLRNQLKQNEIQFEKLYLKKVGFTFNDGKTKKNFKGSFVIQKDSLIIVSIYALMGIELVRAKLTSNEVIILDKHNKSALITNYDYFLRKFGIDFNFYSLQGLLSNSLFLYPTESNYYDGLKKYKHHNTEKYYSFKSLKDKRLDRLNRRNRNNLIVHEINIYPEIFKIFNIYIKDFGSNQILNIDYKDFKDFNNVLFPEFILLKGEQGINNLSVDLKINYLEINDGGSTHFKIPSSYTIKNM